MCAANNALLKYRQQEEKVVKDDFKVFQLLHNRTDKREWLDSEMSLI